MSTKQEVIIYALCDPDTQDVRYVGKTIRPHLRVSEHLRDARNQHIQTPKARWLRKLLPLLPVVIELERCSIDSWEQQERKWIAHYKPQRKLTNLLEGGETAPFEGRNQTQESRLKMRAAAMADGRRPPSRKGASPWNKGEKWSAETREKLRSSHLGQVPWNKGKSWSEDVKAKLSASHTGQPSSRRGKTLSPETIEKLRISHLGLTSGNKGKKWTPEMKARMSKVQLARFRSLRAT